MDAERELVDVRTLSAKIENTNLWVWDTTVESRLRVWLQGTTVSIRSFDVFNKSAKGDYAVFVRCSQ